MEHTTTSVTNETYSDGQKGLLNAIRAAKYFAEVGQHDQAALIMSAASEGYQRAEMVASGPATE